MNPHEERELIDQCRRGDWAALRDLIEPHRDGLYGLAFRMTGSHADADDALQEGLVRVMRGLATFDGRSRFGTWLWRVVSNATTDLIRRRSRRDARDVGQVLDPAAPAGESDPVERLAAGELHDAVNDAIQDLPAPQRSAFVLVAFEGKTYAEAGRILDCPDGTVAWRIAAARERLTQRLAPFLQGAEGGNHGL